MLLLELGVSPATLKRDLAHLRERMKAPVVFDRERNGWRLDAAAQLPGTQYELPGLWLSAEEILALLTMQHLLARLDTGGLLGPHIAPLTERLHKMLGSGVQASAEVARRIRVQSVGARKVHLPPHAGSAARDESASFGGEVAFFGREIGSSSGSRRRSSNAPQGLSVEAS